MFWFSVKFDDWIVLSIMFWTFLFSSILNSISVRDFLRDIPSNTWRATPISHWNNYNKNTAKLWLHIKKLITTNQLVMIIVLVVYLSADHVLHCCVEEAPLQTPIESKSKVKTMSTEEKEKTIKGSNMFTFWLSNMKSKHQISWVAPSSSISHQNISMQHKIENSIKSC